MRFDLSSAGAVSPDGFSLHIHTVRPLASTGMSCADSKTTYVAHVRELSCALVKVTAGQLNDTEGPRVWEITGCRVETYFRETLSERLKPPEQYTTKRGLSWMVTRVKTKRRTYVEYMYTVSLGRYRDIVRPCPRARRRELLSRVNIGIPR